MSLAELTTQLTSLEKQSPSGPDFSQSTIGYCEKSINLALDSLSELLLDPAEPQEDLLITIGRLRNMRGLIGASAFKVSDDGNLQMTDFTGKKILVTTVNPLLQTLYRFDTSLGVPEYALPLANRRSNSSQRTPINYLGFNTRFEYIAENGPMPSDDPKAQIIAIAYVTQVAKNAAVDYSHKLLERVQNVVTGKVTIDRQNPSGFVEAIGKQIGGIKRDEAFITKGLSAIKAVAEEAKLDDAQITLLLDLAFMREVNLSAGQITHDILSPIVQLVATNQWEEAYTYRDFLLHYFSDIFPEWRSREDQKQNDTKSYANLNEVFAAAISGGLTISIEDIPVAYRDFIPSAIRKKIEQAEDSEIKRILNATLPISKDALFKLSIADEKQTWEEALIRRFGDHAQEADSILHKISRIQGKAAFNWFYERVNPLGNSGGGATQVYHHLKDTLLTLLSNESNGIAKELYTPTHRNIVNLELKNGTHQLKCRGKKKEYRVNFGTVVKEIITHALSQNEQEIKGIANIHTLRQIFVDSYTQALHEQPNLQEFSLSQYLHALLKSVGSDIDPDMVEFIETLV